MRLSILELDQIRAQTKALLLKEIIENFSDSFWDSSKETKMLQIRLINQHAELDATSEDLLEMMCKSSTQD